MKKGKVKKIIKEEYKKLKLEQAQNQDYLEEMLESALDQMNQHSELMKELTYYLTTEKDDKELAKEFVKAHGQYTRKIKEVMDSLD